MEDDIQEMVDAIIEAVCQVTRLKQTHSLRRYLGNLCEQSIPKLSTQSNRLEDLPFTIDRFDKNFEESNLLKIYRRTSEYLQKHAGRRAKLLEEVEELPIVGGDRDSKGEPLSPHRILIAIFHMKILRQSQTLTVAVSFLQTLDLSGLAN